MTRISALIVLLAVSMSLLADDKQDRVAAKADGKSVKGTVSKTDPSKKCVTLKTENGEKEYTLGEELVVVLGTGNKIAVSLKRQRQANPNAQRQYMQGVKTLYLALKTGNHVEFILADKDQVAEVHQVTQPQSDKALGKPITFFTADLLLDSGRSSPTRRTPQKPADFSKLKTLQVIGGQAVLSHRGDSASLTASLQVTNRKVRFADMARGTADPPPVGGYYLIGCNVVQQRGALLPGSTSFYFPDALPSGTSIEVTDYRGTFHVKGKDGKTKTFHLFSGTAK